MHPVKTLCAATLALGLATLPALAVDPTGTWQTTTGESRYEVVYCGDGTQICATLTWLRDDARTPENLAYLNRQVITGAVQSTPAKWRGDLVFGGDTYNGSVTVTGTNSLKLTGCVAIACESFEFIRI